MKMNIRIVEDDKSLLNNLTLLINGEHDMCVTGSFASAEQAMRKTNWAQTDILLVDLDLPQMSGIDLILDFHSRYPDLRMIVYTIHEDRPSVLDAIKAGACGYLLKGTRPAQLIEALHEIFRGGAPMSPRIARSVLAELQQDASEKDPTKEAESKLTFREREVLRFCEQGMLYKEIATTLKISPHTVHSHIRHIYRKLRAKNQTDAIRKSRSRGIL